MDQGIPRTFKLLVTTDNPHLLRPVVHFGAPLVSARAVVVLIHGRGQSPDYMREFFAERLDCTDVAYVAPTAADNTWYPYSFLSPLTDNHRGLENTLQCMSVLQDTLLDQGIAPGQIIWCGFSQGACVVSQFVSLNPHRWGGLIALTGGLIGPQGTTWPITGDFDGMPAYFTTSESDPHVPEDRVRDTASVFARAGASVSVEFFLGRPHEINNAEINRSKFIVASC